MPQQQTINGKAFEYACLCGIVKVVNSYGQGVTSTILKDISFDNTKKCFDSIVDSIKKRLLLSAGEEIAKRLKDLEPRLIYPVKGLSDEVILSIQPDKGQQGDVRDVLAMKICAQAAKAGWEIGLSCKHNHTAIRHQRLSPTIDIGKEWLGFCAGGKYFGAIDGVFRSLDSYVNEGKPWSSVKNKESEVYIPLLNAVINCIEDIFDQEGSIACKNLLQYLIGNIDFYKAILLVKEKQALLQAYNFNKTLGEKADKIRPNIQIKTLHLPENYRICMKDKSKTTLLIEMDKGWQISMRIHSASTLVEKSLKLDVQFVGVPSDLYNDRLFLHI